MEALIRPESGLMFWTISIFILLVLVLSKTAWKPLMKSVEEREHAIKHDREAAEKARIAAEKIKAELDERLAAFKHEADRRLEEAVAEGNRERTIIIEEARKAGELYLENAKKELEASKMELEKDLRTKVGDLALMAAQKVLVKNIDQKTNKELVDHFLKDAETKGIHYKPGN